MLDKTTHHATQAPSASHVSAGAVSGVSDRRASTERVITHAQQRAVLGLVTTAALWGLTFPLTKIGVRYVSPDVVVFGRFLLASLSLVPFVSWRAFSSPLIWCYGLLLGGLNALLQLLQAHSLQHISASRCAFILGSNVLFVPILEQWTGLRRVQWVDVAATLVCLVGLFVLTGADFGDVGRGDFLALLAAFGFALYVIAVTFAGQQAVDYRPLTLLQLGVTTAVSLVVAVPTFSLATFVAWPVWAIVVICGVGCTLFPVLLQCKYQPTLRAHTAALIITLEPAFAAVLAFVFLDEPMTRDIVLGGALMLLAACLPQVPNRLRAYARH